MPTWDYVCAKGHVFDGLYQFDEVIVDCRVCRGQFGIAAEYPPLSIESVSRLVRRIQIAQYGRDIDSVEGRLECLSSSVDDYDFLSKFALLRDGEARRVILSMPAWMAKNANSLRIVVHRDPRTGEYSFPGSINSPVPPGMEKVEVTNLHQARQIEKAVSAQETAKASANHHAQREHYNGLRSAGEKDVKAAMPRMSQIGKAFADHALADNHEREARASTRVLEIDAGFDALSNDRSNREGHSDAETGWKTVRE